MKFIAVIGLRLMESLGSREACESKLLEVIQETFWSTTPPANQEQNIIVELADRITLDIEMELNLRDAETVKDIIHEAFLLFFDPEFASEIEVEINTEL